MVDRQVTVRAKWLRVLLLCGLSLLIVRLVYIQIFKSETWAQAAQGIWQETDKIQAVRGTIYDRNGKMLAYTTVAYDVRADLKMMQAAKQEVENPKKKPGKELEPWQGDPRYYAQKLAPLLKMPEEKIYQTLTQKDVVGVDLKQAVDADTAEKIDRLGLKGIYLHKTTTRHYPNGSLAAHLLGYVTNDGKGGSGVELQYDSVLRGQDGVRKFLKDNEGNPLPYEKENVQPAVDGKDVWLTIDETIQHYAEDALDHLVSQYKPNSASIVVADPNTGEILALANRPTFNPNKFWESKQEVLDNNRAVNAAFEPGSTFKIVTMTAALAEKKVTLDATFNSGSITVQGKTIHDWNNIGWGTITFRQGMEHSSNVGMVILGQRLGKQMLFDYIYKFGFNQRTGVDLPGEGDSVLFNPGKMSDLDLAVSSFGQGNAVTPMQQVAAVSAVANGGSVMRPFVMKEIRDPKTGATVQEQKPHVISQVATPEVMATMRSVLEGIVKNDETKAGYIEGYHIAGKTGTAQIAKPTGGYYSDRYICSFIGFAPADKPKVLVYVTVDSPSNDLQFGNIVATPFAKEVFANVLPYLGMQAQQAKAAVTAPDRPVKYSTVPNWAGMDRKQAEQLAKANEIRLQILGSGDQISLQWPKPGSNVPAGSSAIVIAGQVKDDHGNVQVPDLTGKSMREAFEILSMLGLVPDISGSGYVIGQEQKAGSFVPAGSKIKLTLGSN
ncbi:PASTA domain-containing penicillin-binding protein [Effusibacillus pohliae]|uniref:PASTA domain-containing penicillin-binding protein n=1 Tax=Effusibacillus pohliae TaxID=232270 RepID=UPI00037F54AE|nr:PASTA domain-containing penicillin-binding protein [Effusibacillus pohliae]